MQETFQKNLCLFQLLDTGKNKSITSCPQLSNKHALYSSESGERIAITEGSSIWLLDLQKRREQFPKEMFWQRLRQRNLEAGYGQDLNQAKSEQMTGFTGGMNSIDNEYTAPLLTSYEGEQIHNLCTPQSKIVPLPSAEAFATSIPVGGNNRFSNWADTLELLSVKESDFCQFMNDAQSTFKVHEIMNALKGFQSSSFAHFLKNNENIVVESEIVHFGPPEFDTSSNLISQGVFNMRRETVGSIDSGDGHSRTVTQATYVPLCYSSDVVYQACGDVRKDERVVKKKTQKEKGSKTPGKCPKKPPTRRPPIEKRPLTRKTRPTHMGPQTQKNKFTLKPELSKHKAPLGNFKMKDSSNTALSGNTQRQPLAGPGNRKPLIKAISTVCDLHKNPKGNKNAGNETGALNKSRVVKSTGNTLGSEESAKLAVRNQQRKFVPRINVTQMKVTSETSIKKPLPVKEPNKGPKIPQNQKCSLKLQANTKSNKISKSIEEVYFARRNAKPDLRAVKQEPLKNENSQNVTGSKETVVWKKNCRAKKNTDALRKLRSSGRKEKPKPFNNLRPIGWPSKDNMCRSVKTFVKTCKSSSASLDSRGSRGLSHQRYTPANKKAKKRALSKSTKERRRKQSQKDKCVKMLVDLVSLVQRKAVESEMKLTQQASPKKGNEQIKEGHRRKKVAVARH